MKILVVAPQPFFAERGTPIAVRMLAESLRDLGHEVDLLVYHCGEEVDLPGVRIWRSGRPPFVGNVPIGISWQKLACDIWLIRKKLALLRIHSYDVIHAVEEAIFLAVALPGTRGAKVVYDMDSSLSDQLTDKWWPLRPLRQLLVAIERHTVRRVDVVLPVCEALAGKVRPWTDPRRVVVMPDVPVGDPRPRMTDPPLRSLAPPGAVLGLYVGNLERYQGMDLLLESVALLEVGSPFRLLVIGGAPADVERYRSAARKRGIDDRVRFLGPRPLDELPSHLAQADILISPRIQGENTPMKVYSYMQSGKAIVATAIRSHTQVLADATAELVAPKAEAMAAGIARLVSDPERRAGLGQAAQAVAERDYSHAAYRSRLAQAYRMLES